MSLCSFHFGPNFVYTGTAWSNSSFSSAGQPCRYLDTFHACKVFSELKIHPSFCKCFSFDILRSFFHLSVPLFFQLRAIFHCQEAHHSICKMGNSLYTFHIIYENVKYSISKTLPKISRLLILPGEVPQRPSTHSFLCVTSCVNLPPLRSTRCVSLINHTPSTGKSLNSVATQAF